VITPESDSEVSVHSQEFTAHVRLLGVHAVLECTQHRDKIKINLPSYANAFTQSITTLDNRARPIPSASRRVYTARRTRCARDSLRTVGAALFYPTTARGALDEGPSKQGSARARRSVAHPRVYIHTLIEKLFFPSAKTQSVQMPLAHMVFWRVFAKQHMANYDPFADPAVGIVYAGVR